MKKNLLLSLFIMMCMALLAQTQTQKGYSFRYNGKNPRTLLSDVQIEYGNPKEAVKSDSTGTFWLVFNNMKMGDHIGLVTVKKREMMVFNQQAVDEWSIRKEPLCLILCDANEFEKQKQDLIEIGRREAKKKYDRQKAELERQLEASQIDRTKYEAKLDSAWQELDRLHKHIDEYADLFARIDESEIDSIAQRAMDLFNQGQVDEAVKLFEQGNYLEKLKASNRAIHQADLLIETVEQGKAKAERDRDEQLQSLKAQIAAYKMQNEWEKARTLLKGLADELNTFDALFQYARFCKSQNSFKEADTYYHRALSHVRVLAQDNPQTYEPYVALTLNDLGNLYCKIQCFTESEALYIEALEISQRLAQDNPQAYESNVASTLANLGILYKDTKRFTESEAMQLEALKISQRLAQSNPKVHEPHVANTLNNLAILYSETQRCTESEALFLESLQTRKRLAQANTQAYEPDVAQTLGNLALLYYSVQRIEESEAAYLEELEINRHLAQTNPQAYEPNVAKTLFGLANLYKDAHRLSESEVAYLEALGTYKYLAQANPQVYEPEVAKILNNLAILYSKTQRFSESEAAYLEALEIRKHMVHDNPQVFEPYVASTLNNLAILYSKTQRFSESEAAYLEALEIRRRLARVNPQAYEPDVASTLHDLGLLLYLKQGQHIDAIPIFEEAVAIYRKWGPINLFQENCYEESLYCLTQLYPTINNHISNYDALEELIPFLNRHYQKDPGAWKEDYVNALVSQSFQCIFMQNLVRAEQYAREALGIDESKTSVYSHLAASLLFQGKFEEAEQIYRQYKSELNDTFQQDLNDFEAAGIIPEERKADAERIRKILTE